MTETASTAEGSPLWQQVTKLNRDLELLRLEFQERGRSVQSEMVERTAVLRKELREAEQAAKDRESAAKRDQEERSRFWTMVIFAIVLCVSGFVIGLVVGDTRSDRRAHDHVAAASAPAPAEPAAR